MNKAQQRVRERRITRMQNERREAKMNGAVVPEELPLANTEKVARKSTSFAAWIARRDPPSEATVDALVALTATEDEQKSKPATSANEVLAELEKQGLRPETYDELRELGGTPGTLMLPPERHGLRGRFLIWLNLLAVRLRIRSRRRQKALTKAIAQQ